MLDTRTADELLDSLLTCDECGTLFIRHNNYQKRRFRQGEELPKLCSKWCNNKWRRRKLFKTLSEKPQLPWTKEPVTHVYDWKNVNINLKREDFEKLDNLAKEKNIARGIMAREMILSFLEEEKA